MVMVVTVRGVVGTVVPAEAATIVIVVVVAVIVVLLLIMMLVVSIKAERTNQKSNTHCT